jgi:hypothetical protein
VQRAGAIGGPAVPFTGTGRHAIRDRALNRR